MVLFLIKKLRRCLRMRVKRTFALTQLVIIILIVYLAKRSRDRHKAQAARRSLVPGGVLDPVEVPGVDVDGGAGLLPTGPSADLDLLDSVQNKRMDVFEGVPDIQPPDVQQPEPLYKVVEFPPPPPVEFNLNPPQPDLNAPAGRPPLAMDNFGVGVGPPQLPNIAQPPQFPQMDTFNGVPGGAPQPAEGPAPQPLQFGAVPAAPLPGLGPQQPPQINQFGPPPLGLQTPPPQANAFGAPPFAPQPPQQADPFALPQPPPPAAAAPGTLPVQANPFALPAPAPQINLQQPPLIPVAPAPLPAQNPPLPNLAQPTFHFPVAGEEVAMGALENKPRAPEPVYDANGLEILPRPPVLPDINPASFSLDVTEEMINSFKVKLPPLLPDYKNPCWVEMIPDDFTYEKSFFNECHYVLHTNKLKHGPQYAAFEEVLKNRTASGYKTRVRCFPYFFLIGVGKCGTTDIYDTLRKYFSEMGPVFLKEPHYWEWKRCYDKMSCHEAHRTPTFAEYLDSFDSSADFIGNRAVTGPDGAPYYDMILGDFTPSTLAFHPCWKYMPGNEGRDEPRYMNAHYIRAIRPESKFITIMRDPVERIFSNYRMSNRMAAVPTASDAQDFHKAMAEIITYMKSCMLTKTARACAYSIMKFDYGTHVTNSMYEIFISDWFRLFPRDQFLFLRMEDYMESRVPNINKIVQFLQLEPMTPEKEMMIGAKSVVNQAPPAAMLNETRTMLQDFFRPFNLKLAEILGSQEWTWGY